MWKGQIDYWKSNGTNSDYLGRPDHWGQTVNSNPNAGYKEFHDGK